MHVERDCSRCVYGCMKLGGGIERREQRGAYITLCEDLYYKYAVLRSTLRDTARTPYHGAGILVLGEISGSVQVEDCTTEPP